MDEPFVIGDRPGYDGRIGVVVSMLENARTFLRAAVRDLDVAALDARPAGAINTIGSILAHLPAAEMFLGFRAFEDRRATPEERAALMPRFGFENSTEPAGRDLASYLADLDKTRRATLERMRGLKESWLTEPRTFAGKPSNVFYFWLHYLEDEARHTGQIILIRKHLMSGASSEFDPYVF